MHVHFLTMMDIDAFTQVANQTTKSGCVVLLFSLALQQLAAWGLLPSHDHCGFGGTPPFSLGVISYSVVESSSSWSRAKRRKPEVTGRAYP